MKNIFDDISAAALCLQQMTNLEYHHHPRKLIAEYHQAKLFHYTPLVESKNTIPLLIVFATVNRPEILDITPQSSFIGHLLKHGVNVFLLDWGFPDAASCDASFDTYVYDYIDKFIDKVCNHSAVNKINLLGICQGGVLSLCHTSIFDKINKLVLVSTPIDFHTSDNIISAIIRNMELKFLDDQAYIPGPWLTHFFISLRPIELVYKKYFNFSQRLADDDFVNTFLYVEKWLKDAPDQTRKSFETLINDLYLKNKLINGNFELRDKIINLRAIDVPVLNIMAEKDKIVPASASLALKKYIHPSLYSEHYMPGGHITIYLNNKSKMLAAKIAAWLY